MSRLLFTTQRREHVVDVGLEPACLWPRALSAFTKECVLSLTTFGWSECATEENRCPRTYFLTQIVICAPRLVFWKKKVGCVAENQEMNTFYCWRITCGEWKMLRQSDLTEGVAKSLD